MASLVTKGFYSPKPRKNCEDRRFSTSLTGMKSCTPAPKDASKLVVFFRFFEYFLWHSREKQRAEGDCYTFKACFVQKSGKWCWEAMISPRSPQLPMNRGKWLKRGKPGLYLLSYQDNYPWLPIQPHTSAKESWRGINLSFLWTFISRGRENTGEIIKTIFLRPRGWWRSIQTMLTGRHSTLIWYRSFSI